MCSVESLSLDEYRVFKWIQGLYKHGEVPDVSKEYVEGVDSSYTVKRTFVGSAFDEQAFVKLAYDLKEPTIDIYSLPGS